MMATLISIIGTKVLGALGGVLGFAGAGALLFLKGKAAGKQAGATQAKAEVASAIAENHAVEQKQAGATTDPEADNALDAAADTDHS